MQQANGGDANNCPKRRGSEKRYQYSAPKYRCLFSDPLFTQRKEVRH